MNMWPMVMKMMKASLVGSSPATPLAKRITKRLDKLASVYDVTVVKPLPLAQASRSSGAAARSEVTTLEKER